jgi:Family of unknown function (DUF6153)
MISHPPTRSSRNGVRTILNQFRWAVAADGRWSIRRWVLLVAIIAGILGMHVLTGGTSGAHGSMPSAPTVEMTTSAPLGSRTHHDDPVGDAGENAGTPQGGAHHVMAACILFVVTGAALRLLASSNLRGRMGMVDLLRSHHRPRFDRMRAPPAAGQRRILLCVIRI